MKILVPTDFSGNSKSGIRFAQQLARQSGGQLIYYHAIELIKPTSWNDIRFAGLVKSRIDLYTSRLLKYIDYMEKNGFTAHGVQAEFVVEVGENAAAMIAAHAKKSRATVICMSTRGAGRLRKLFGTHTTDLIAFSVTPLIVVPRRYRVKPVNNVMYASDFTSAGRELNRLSEFLAPVNHSISVFHYDLPQHLKENAAKLRRKTHLLARPGVTFSFRKKSAGNSLADEIRKDIRMERPDLLAMFVRTGLGWFDRIFGMSETRRMTFKPMAPLLVMRKGRD
jgi:nucleotide-binding universal stress UspA family protein